jgi:hypothetical protein
MKFRCDELQLTPHRLSHFGSEGGAPHGSWSGSYTELDLDHKIGATILVSTEPAPSVELAFTGNIVDSHMKTPASTQDSSGAAWDAQRLSVGVARLLWLMNATVTDRPVKVPGNPKVPELKLGQPLPKGPLVPPGYVLVGPGMMMESQRVWNYQQTMMG